MFTRSSIARSGLKMVAMCVLLAGSQTASAQVYSRGRGAYNASVTYVSYQPAQYRPVYTDREVVYTAPARVRRAEYVDLAPVREVVRYIPQPVRTRTVYVEPEYNYYPRAVVYSSGYRYGRHHYGYSSGYRGLRHLGRIFRRGYHRSRRFGLHLGRRHFRAYRGHHRGGFSLRVGY